MSYINRTIIVERDSQSLNTQILTMINEFPGVQAAVEEAETAASSAATAASEASAAAGEATAAATNAVNAAKFIFADQAALLADNRAFSAGDIILTRAEGYGYEVVGLDPDITSAGGVGLRVLSGPGGYNLKAFGARGDGASDDSAVTLRFIERVIASNSRGIAPAGDYVLDAAVVSSCGNERFTLVGESENSTRFIVPATNTGGGILISSAGRSGQAVFADFSIVKRGSGGVGLRYTQPEGGNQHQRGVVCRDVTIAGENKTTDTFTAGYFDFSGTWRPLLQNCKASGPFVGVDMTDASPRYAAAYGFCLDGCYDPTVDSCYAWGQHTSIRSSVFTASVLSVANVGGGLVRLTLDKVNPFTPSFQVRITGTVDYDGVYTVQARTDTTLDITAAFTTSQTGQITMSTGPEAIRIVNSVLTECRRSLHLHRPTGREPVLWMDNCHINWRDVGLVLEGCKLVTISHLHSYNQDTGNAHSGVASDILMRDCSEFIVTGNTFHYDGAADRIGIFVESDTPGEGDFGIISNNIFSGIFATGVWLTENCAGVIVGPNVYGAGVTQRVSDASSNNTVIDGRTETGGTWVPNLSFGGSSAGITYASRSGAWRISGGMLHFQISMTLTAKGSATGAADISLPTTWPGIGNPQTGGAVVWSEYAAMSGVAAPGGRLTSATNLRLSQAGASAVASLTDANFSNTSSVVICGSIRLA